MVSEERRSYDASILAIKQEIKDLKELILLRETTCQQSILLKLQDQQIDIGTLKRFMHSIELPVKVIGWTVVIFVAGVLGVFGSRSGKFLWSKFF